MSSQQVKMAFEPEGRLVPIESILATRTISQATRLSTKYLRIQSSVREIGLVEPLMVHPDLGTGKSGRYVLLDGHLRLDVLRGMGATEVLCLISTDDESFTYNHKVSQISPIQEHFMIVKALNNGVTEERIAATLNMDVSRIRKKRDLLDGICPEAVELLRDKRASPGALRQFKKVLPMRQIAMAELMIASHNFTSTYAECLLAATPQEDLVDKDNPKEIPGLRPQDLARMEREMKVLERDFRRIEESHGKNTLNLVLAAGYIRKLLGNAAVLKFMTRKYGDVLREFEKLAEAADLGDGSEAVESS
jgi:ParB-like chromosome segregation protein Spo0J